MVVRGEELLFEPLFLKANTTLNATVIFFLFSFTLFFDPYLREGLSHYIGFLSDHLDRTLVNHLNLHSNTCSIKHLLWLSVNCDGCKW